MTPSAEPLPPSKAPTAAADDGYRLCQPALALRALVLVQAASLVVLLFMAGSWTQALAALGPMIFAGVGGTLLWLALACGLRRALARQPSPRRIAALAALGAVAAPAACAPLLAWDMAVASPPRLLALPLVGAGLALPVALWIEARARSLRPADADARLAELQSRIRPHFLFNALNTALALVQVDPPRAERVLEDLAELFRTAMAEHGAAVSLDEEAALARRYLDIEQVRFGERLRVLWELDPAAGRARVPPLLLQPLVENAVRHGIEPSPDGGIVRVRTQARRGEVAIEIDNTLTDAAPSVPGQGIALANVQDRLRLMHDIGAHFDARRLEGWWRVRIVIPDDRTPP
ncbi:histidine kinase [Aquincola sp. MAHUQ-54]|uniref:Histidine kinase n=1 Tax=Aquincola agrisoli TaxID=3119538 RepID=A0AAW9Q7K9_9BURK